jgi:hypothetical protein
MIVAVTESCQPDGTDTYFVDTSKFPAGHPYLAAINEALACEHDTAGVPTDHSFGYGDAPRDVCVALPAMVEAAVTIYPGC